MWARQFSGVFGRQSGRVKISLFKKVKKYEKILQRCGRGSFFGRSMDIYKTNKNMIKYHIGVKEGVANFLANQ